jgi:hypothetical protein
MADAKKPQKSGNKQADEPEKLLKSGVPVSVGKATQFKPGQSGNPAGKPKGTKHINTWIQELAEDEEFTAMLLDLKVGFVEYKGAPIKAIIKQAINEAVAGRDARERQAAREWIARYGWPTKNEVTGEDGAPLMPVALDSAILNRLAQNGGAPSGPTTDSAE